MSNSTQIPENKFYKGNSLLKGAGYQYSYTAKEIKEFIKCKNNPIYFIKKYIKVVNINRGFVPLDLYPFQEDLVTKIHDNRNVVGMVGRQSGKSTTVSAYLVWCILFKDNYTAAILANKAATAREIMQKCTKAYEALPFFLQQGVKVWNKGMIELENGSRIICAATTSSAIRGYSINCVKGDTKVVVSDDLERIFHTNINNVENINKTCKLVQQQKDNFMFYIIYKITDSTNNQIYVGFHKTNNIDDGYMGSGVKLKKEIASKGIENFKKEILFTYDNLEDALIKEAEIVNKDFIVREDTYNMSLGGNVCILYGENNGFYKKKHTEESRDKISKANKGRLSSKKDIAIIFRGVHYHSMKTLRESNNISRRNLLCDAGNPSVLDTYFINNNKQKEAELFFKKREEFISTKCTRMELTKERMRNKVITDEFREKCSKRFKGVKKSKSHCEKISKGLTGHKKSEEWVNKINKNPEKIEKSRLKHLGSKRSDESKQKMSDVRKKAFAEGRLSSGKDSIYIKNSEGKLKRWNRNNPDIPEGWNKCKS